jgi:hypothetical protein
MYPRQWEVVEEVSERTATGSVSGALRWIVMEYQRIRRERRVLEADASCEEEVKALRA